jgi:GT2 family glycosyltransferase
MSEPINKSPKVAVVLLNWNGRHWMERFLPGVLSSTYPNLEVIIGDNASTDDSVSYLKANFPSVRIIQNEQNFGFAGGYNKVLKQVEADYYVLLNTDVEVAGDWIQPVINCMEKDALIAAAQPLFILQTDKQYLEYSGAAGGLMDTYGYMFCQGRLFQHVEKDCNQFTESKEIFWACGACLFIKAPLFHLINGFDSDFFAHQEEVDLCWRLKNIGYKIYYCAESRVYHVGGGMLPPSNPLKTFLNFRNSLYLLYKNLPSNQFYKRFFVRLILDGAAGAKFLTEGKWKETIAILKAHFAFYSNWSILNKKRKATVKKVELENMPGFYAGSIIGDYYFKGKKNIKELDL